MLRQIQYFQAVVRHNSFSEAAEECHISQSAISQQVKALEQELGFQLLERHNRSFTLMPAGAYFYKKSLILVADYAQMCQEAEKIAQGDEAVLKIGYLRRYNGLQLQSALADFAAAFPQVSLQLMCGDHEELFRWLRHGDADVVLNDQRRAFSEEYVNLVLETSDFCVEIAAHNIMAEASSVSLQELKNLPCILVADSSQQAVEQAYFQTVVGFRGTFLFANTLEKARLFVASGQGFLPVTEKSLATSEDTIRRLPLYRNDAPIHQKLCLFWKKENSGYYVESFADCLEARFTT